MNSCLHLLTPWHFKALVRELKIWADLRHNNVLLLQGFYLDSTNLESAWIIALWHENGNVASFIERFRPDEAGRLKLVSLHSV